VSEQGWAAECDSCPTTVGGYGEQVKVRREFVVAAAADAQQYAGAAADAQQWASLHHDANPGHRVTVTCFTRMEFTLVNPNPDVMRALFGSANASMPTQSI
jgi:hypothetical protein